MKKIARIAAVLILVFLSCKDKQKQEIKAPEPELSILEKVANAHGFQNWATVNELKFTFNVARDTNHFERDWVWKPKTNDVSAKSLETGISYNRKALDSISTKTDAAFINDKFWLLAPFQLIWDQNNFTYELTAVSEAPLSKKSMQKLTIVYGSEGGYTPGDAYDFYFGEDHIIQEWVFRKENSAAPSMITTWEDYETVGGMKFAKSHKKEGENFHLYFTKIEIN